MKKEIKTLNAPQPIGPYSQAILASGNMLFVSMQIPLTPLGDQVAGGIQAQTRQVIKNVESIVIEAGGDSTNIIKTMVYMKDLSQFAQMNEVYKEYFNQSKPARGAVEVSSIPKDCLIAMDAIAII